MWKVHAGWLPYVRNYFQSEDGRGLLSFLEQRMTTGAHIYPPEPLRALSAVAPKDVRVVILGQDPYHGPGQAEGLAFSVPDGVRIPPSLRNIFKELGHDLGMPVPASGSLVRWAEQGVLLLNTCLTVEDGQAASHSGRGWETLTDTLVGHCGGPDASPTVFMLWGAHAQKKQALVDRGRHLVLQSNHPSPLSATRGPAPFLGCGHFSAANAWLKEQGRPAVKW
ncbi:uracil-DNA glycosylase [Hydrogenophaga sp. 5NK40-0174]|uniref:uracil-DNA glycosylase n=1 Tax=Hydrogenophaga sp. 5NK40-0174 TaxID=3127649 RepID=UPI00333FD924